MLFTTVVFPEYFNDLRKVGEEVLRTQGMSEGDIKTALDTQAQMQTPFIQALSGFIGTLATGLVVSLIVGAFVRKKEVPAPPTESPQQA
jgi:hypothetical protein